MANEPEYTIGELAELAGVTPRTIRYYTGEGLLPQPDTQGRYARYGKPHLERLRMIAELKAEYLPLRVIRERLDADSAAAQPHSDQHQGSPFALGGNERGLRRRPSDARRGALHEAGESYSAGLSHPVLGNPLSINPAPLQLGRYEFFPHQTDADDSGDAERVSSDEHPAPVAEHWQRIRLAAGVELHIREPLSAQRRKRLEELIRAARDVLHEEE
ncbi:MAG: MerR family transcriptional regulator [Oscillochloris sp.]|nr:MerR family transcriptional regulator [Oscillochloris sp.]